MLPNEAIEETEPAQGHVRNRSECPSPNRKRTRTCLTERGQRMAARKTQRGDATGSCSSVENDGGCDEEDSKPSPVTTTSSALIGSDPVEEVVQEEATKEGDKWPPLLRPTKEAARPKVVVVLWRKMEVVAMKNIRNRLP